MRRISTAIALLLLALGCDRNIEPFVPGEEPQEPDLARIFPDTSGAQPPAPVTPAQPPSAAEMAGAAPGGTPISGVITLAPELADQVPPGAVLFLVARGAGTRGGPPLAVQRLTVSEFPIEFEIGPGDVMIPSMRFEGQISLSARIDLDGNAVSRQPGDLQGASAAPVAPGATGVSIVIDEQL